jgi:hypothetical protein
MDKWPLSANDSIMGPSQKWIHERSFVEGLMARWAKSITDSEKDFFQSSLWPKTPPTLFLKTA